MKKHKDYKLADQGIFTKEFLKYAHYNLPKMLKKHEQYYYDVKEGILMDFNYKPLYYHGKGNLPPYYVTKNYEVEILK